MSTNELVVILGKEIELTEKWDFNFLAVRMSTREKPVYLIAVKNVFMLHKGG